MLHTMRFHQTGKARKQMVTTIADTLGIKPRYEAAPTFAYTIGGFTVTRGGDLEWDDATDAATVATVLAALRDAGYDIPADEEPEATSNKTAEPGAITAEESDAEEVNVDEDHSAESESQPEPEAEAVEPTQPEPTESEFEADEPEATDTAEETEVNVDEPQSETEAKPVALPDEPVGAAVIETTVSAPALTPDESGSIPDEQLDRLAAMLDATQPHEEQMLGGLTVEIPAGKVNTANLEAMLKAKGALIRKALGINVLGFIEQDGKVIFPWFQRELTAEEAHAYTTFITLLCHQSKELKRASSRPSKAGGNEKYAMRCFLLRLGFIGAEYKDDRRILLRNLDGNSSWANGDPRKHKEAENVVDATVEPQQADQQAAAAQAQAAQKKTDGDVAEPQADAGLPDATGRELIVIRPREEAMAA